MMLLRSESKPVVGLTTALPGGHLQRHVAGSASAGLLRIPLHHVSVGYPRRRIR